MDFPALTRTGALEFFSEFGKTIYNPQGILYWTRKAKAKARINATIGSARGPEGAVYPEGGNARDHALRAADPLVLSGAGDRGDLPVHAGNGHPRFPLGLEKVDPGARGRRVRAARKTTASTDPHPRGSLPQSASARECSWTRAGPSSWPTGAGRTTITCSGKSSASPSSTSRCSTTAISTWAGLLSAIQRVWLEQDNAVALLNFPNNPTGFCPSVEAGRRLVESLEQLAEGTTKRLVLLFDDAYESYVYDPAAMQSSLFYLCRPAAEPSPGEAGRGDQRASLVRRARGHHHPGLSRRVAERGRRGDAGGGAGQQVRRRQPGPVLQQLDSDPIRGHQGHGADGPAAGRTPQDLRAAETTVRDPENTSSRRWIPTSSPWNRFTAASLAS